MWVGGWWWLPSDVSNVTAASSCVPVATSTGKFGSTLIEEGIETSTTTYA